MSDIEVKDHNSKIIGLIHEQLQEPITFISKIKGFESVDDYVINLIKDDLISIREGGQGIEDIGEYVIKYLEKNEYLEKIYPISPSTSPSHSAPTNSYVDDYEDISVTLRLKKNFAYVLRLLAKHYDEGDIDKFTSEEVSKIICALAESSSTILGPSISDELEQHIQSLLKDEQKKT